VVLLVGALALLGESFFHQASWLWRHRSTSERAPSPARSEVAT
jgi:hypothetical protein